MFRRIFIRLFHSILVFFSIGLVMVNCRQHDSVSMEEGVSSFEILKRANSLIPSNMDSAAILLQSVRNNLSFTDDSTKAYFNNNLGIFYWYKSEFDTAIAWFRKTLNIKEKSALLRFKAQAANNMGTLYSLTGHSDSAAKYLEIALNIDLKRNNTRGINKNLYDLGLHYKRKSQYHLALDYLNRLKENLRKNDDSKMRIYAVYMLGNVYFELDSLSKALDYYNEALSISRKLNDTALTVNNLICLTAVFSEQPGKLDSTLHHIRQCFPFAQKSQDYTTLLLLCLNAGSAFHLNGFTDSALVWYRKGYQYAELADNPYQVAGFFKHYANTLFADGQYNQARTYYQKSLDIAKKIQSFDKLADAYLGLAKTDSAEGNFISALTNYQSGIKLNDSIMNQEIKSKIAELQIIHQSKEKESLINKLKEKERFNRLLQISGIIIALAMMMVLILALLFTTKRRIVAEQNIIIKQNEQERILTLLNSNKQELTGKALSLARAEKTIAQLKNDIHKMIPSTDENTGQHLKSLIKMLQTEHSSEKLWNEFEQRFDDLNDGFLAKLLKLYPTLSPAEARLCAMIKMQLSSKEIAHISGRSVRTVEFTRLKIRQKMDLGSGVNLTQHLLKI